MLDVRDERTWAEIERDWATEVDEPVLDDLGKGSEAQHGRDRLPAAVVGGGWGAVLLVLFGVPWAGLAVGTAVLLLWLLWRFLPQLERAGIAAPGLSSRAEGLPGPGKDGASEMAGCAPGRPAPGAEVSGPPR